MATMNEYQLRHGDNNDAWHIASIPARNLDEAINIMKEEYIVPEALNYVTLESGDEETFLLDIDVCQYNADHGTPCENYEGEDFNQCDGCEAYNEWFELRLTKEGIGA